MQKQKLAKDVDGYIAAFPDDIQEKLESLRATIKKAAPEATEKISYRIPTFTFHGNLVHFAAFAEHIGFYPGPTGVAAFKKELASYETAKGTIKFPRDRRLPLALVTKIVKYRVKENAGKRSSKK